jgi:hypothetical protein
MPANASVALAPPAVPEMMAATAGPVRHRHSSECERTGHHHLWCHKHPTRRRRESRHHTKIMSGVGDSDRNTVGVLVQLQPYLDAIRGRPKEAEAEGPFPLGSVG